MYKERSAATIVFRLLLLLFVAYLLYLVIGATVPFSRHPAVSQDFKTSIYQTHFTRDGAGVDRVMLLEDNQSALSERLRLLSHAQERVILSTFDLKDDYSGFDVISLLWEAAERGVTVQLLVDGATSMIHMGDQTPFLALAAHPNVEIKTYNPPNPLKPSTFNGRMHDKYLIVDDDYYILGGRNTYDYFLGEYPTSNPSYDREVLIWNTSDQISESSLSQLVAYFERVWAQDCCSYYHEDETLLERERVQEAITELENHAHDLRIDYYDSFQEIDYRTCTFATGTVTLLSNPIHSGVKEPELLYSLTELMREAKDSVILHTPYAVCDKAMYDSLARIAQSVPSFEMVLNSVANGDNFAASSDYLRNKGALLETGVSLWEYNGGMSYHGKSIVIDDRLSVIGSFNWDMRSAYLDTELMLVVDCARLNAQLRGYMEQIRDDSLLCVDEETYEPNANVHVREQDGKSKALLQVLRVVTRPFRALL